MNNIGRYPNCSMRTEIGNCDPIGGFCTSVNKNVCDALHKVSRPKGEWIPCSERLPSECEVVLASWSCLWKEAIVLARRYEGKWEWAYEHGTDYWQPTELEEYWPEAWQPLPAPYKGGDAE